MFLWWWRVWGMLISHLPWTYSSVLYWVSDILVTDPTIRQPGFDLPRRSWSLLNHFQTGQRHCLSNLHKCGLASSDFCVCGQQQTMNQMVMKLGGGLHSLHEAGDDAVHWLKFAAATALAKWNEIWYMATSDIRPMVTFTSQLGVTAIMCLNINPRIIIWQWYGRG